MLGHEKACGVSMKASNIKELKDRLSKEVATIVPFESSLDVSLSLHHTLINTDFVKELEYYDMQETLFLFNDLEVIGTQLLAEKHTKIKCKLNNGKYISIIVFNDTSLSFNLAPSDELEVVGELNINSYNGFENIQIIAKDFRVNGVQVIDYRNRKDYKYAVSHFDLEDGLILKEEFDNIADLNLLIKEQSPSILYLAPISQEKNDEHLITDLKFLKEVIYVISKRIEINEIMLQKEVKASKYVLNHILEIFEELNLVERYNGKVKPIPREKGYKVNLEDSKTYNEFVESKEVLTLLRSDINTIKKYVIEALE